MKIKKLIKYLDNYQKFGFDDVFFMLDNGDVIEITGSDIEKDVPVSRDSIVLTSNFKGFIKIKEV